MFEQFIRANEQLNNERKVTVSLRRCVLIISGNTAIS